MIITLRHINELRCFMHRDLLNIFLTNLYAYNHNFQSSPFDQIAETYAFFILKLFGKISDLGLFSKSKYLLKTTIKITK